MGLYRAEGGGGGNSGVGGDGMIFTVQSAVDYWRTGKAIGKLKRLIAWVKETISFPYEHANRLKRAKEIIDLYTKGVPIRDILDKYGCSRGTINRHARIAKLPKRPKHFPEKIKLATIVMIEQGRSLVEIKARLGVSEAYVSYLGKEIGRSRYKNGRKGPRK